MILPRTHLLLAAGGLANGIFALHTGTKCSGWRQPCANDVRTSIDCRTAIVPVLHLAARIGERANGRASYGELSAVPKCHPCISLALVRFLPSQWTPSETWACRSGEILWAFMARDGPALVLAMGFGRIG